jgi:K+-sensing histidine kinase KdpD
VTAPGLRKRILFISPKREAQPLLDQLRAGGHAVSIVEDCDGAQALLSSGAFDLAVLPGPTTETLFAQRSLWEGSGGDSWRQSTAAIAHDLRNLLATLERCLRELQRPSENDLMESCRTINTLSAFLLELTEDLQASGQSGLSLTIVDLEDIVEVAAVTVYPSAADRRQRLVIDIEESARHVRADATKLKRVMANLLAHASQESPRLGTVTVSGYREMDACVISVTYTAQTVSLSRLSELFGPADSLGKMPLVGLRSVQDIIEQHGGRLWVESQSGAGTSVFLSVPSPEIIGTESRFSLAPG